jgi:hypothetical protein
MLGSMLHFWHKNTVKHVVRHIGALSQSGTSQKRIQSLSSENQYQYPFPFQTIILIKPQTWPKAKITGGKLRKATPRRWKDG